LHRCSAKSCTLHDASHHAANTTVGLHLLGWLLRVALEADLVAFQVGARGSDRLAVGTELEGVWAGVAVNHHDAIIICGKGCVASGGCE